MHWAAQRRYGKMWDQLVLVAKSEAKFYGKPRVWPVRLQIELVGGKSYDPDNLVGAVKPVIDALVTNGIIKDDTPECVAGVEVTQKKAPRAEHGTLVKILPA